MSAFEAFFYAFYCVGLYPFYYDGRAGCFKIAKFGRLSKFANAFTFFIVYASRLCSIFHVLLGPEVFFEQDKKESTVVGWRNFFTHWTWIQFFTTLHCYWSTGNETNLRLFEELLRLRRKFVDQPRVPRRAMVFFIIVLGYELATFLAFVAILVIRRLFILTVFTSLGILMSNLVFFFIEFSVFLSVCLANDSLLEIEKELTSMDGNGLQFDDTVLRRRCCGRADGFSAVVQFVRRERKAEIHRLRMLHYESFSSVEQISNHYKTLLIYSVGESYVHMVCFVYFILYTVNLILDGLADKKMVNRLPMCVMGATVKLLRLYMLSQCDDMLNQRVKAIRYKLNKFTMSIQRADDVEEIKLFSRQCDIKQFKLSVGGLFNLDAKFLHSALGAALAYVVLLVQFSTDSVLKNDSVDSNTTESWQNYSNGSGNEPNASATPL